MYRGFNIKFESHLTSDVFAGNALAKLQKDKIRESLDNLLSIDGIIDGNKLQQNWFPNIDAEVFISHSHKEERSAIELAGWLKNKFGLTAFIDSTIWGYANDLLKILDNRYCRNPNGQNYNYDKRNISTSHVHVMLCSALSKMMDNCECLMFLNSPNSISSATVIQNETYSPWIYYELTMAGMLQKPLSKHPKRDKLLLKSRSHSAVESKLYESEQLRISYPVDLEEMTKLTTSQFEIWQRKYESELPKRVTPLDKLYELY